jgi:hypothetical protein
VGASPLPFHPSKFDTTQKRTDDCTEIVQCARFCSSVFALCFAADEWFCARPSNTLLALSRALGKDFAAWSMMIGTAAAQQPAALISSPKKKSISLIHSRFCVYNLPTMWWGAV